MATRAFLYSVLFLPRNCNQHIPSNKKNRFFSKYPAMVKHQNKTLLSPVSMPKEKKKEEDDEEEDAEYTLHIPTTLPSISSLSVRFSIWLQCTQDIATQTLLLLLQVSVPTGDSHRGTQKEPMLLFSFLLQAREWNPSELPLSLFQLYGPSEKESDSGWLSLRSSCLHFVCWFALVRVLKSKRFIYTMYVSPFPRWNCKPRCKLGKKSKRRRSRASFFLLSSASTFSQATVSVRAMEGKGFGEKVVNGKRTLVMICTRIIPLILAIDPIPWLHLHTCSVRLGWD